MFGLGLMFGLGIAEIIILSAILFALLLPVFALIDIMGSKFEGENKILWVLIVLLLPYLGSLLYFIIGGTNKIK
ncbi:MAG: PLDc N-terminal domain-containing protein [Saprospiraceae bacterium]